MRNVTITLDDETARWARVEAAKADMSVSRWIGQLLDEQRQRRADYDAARDSYLSRGSQALKPAGSELPSRAELHRR